MKAQTNLSNYLEKFIFEESQGSLPIFSCENKTRIEWLELNGKSYPKYINEFWTSRQRQASSIHEISYRACFKPQLPRFFLELFTKENDTVYDPFSGRGTTVIEAGLLGRNIVSNDINPLSEILCKPRFSPPQIEEVAKRLNEVPLHSRTKNKLDLSMFYHPQTEHEILDLREYLLKRKTSGEEDEVDGWIRMVATNRLTGHSSGFFSVYTLPPNQAVLPKSQIKINKKRNQKPEYRNTREIMLKKTRDLFSDLSNDQKSRLYKTGRKAFFLNNDASITNKIKPNSVQLTVTSPPFLDVVNYSDDNWLRCWFNFIDEKEITKKITMSKTIQEWSKVMSGVFQELYRITKNGGWVAFEVGEVRKGRIRLEESVIPLGLGAGFRCEGVLVNSQKFTKTSNIWGIKNNSFGTNTNRVVLFCK